jgi:hypothetical protein
MTNAFLRTSQLGVFVVAKPSRIIAFILIWNLLCGVIILLNGGMGPVDTLPGFLGVIIVGSYAAFCGLAPVASQKYRVRWCRPDADFQDAKVGFITLGLVGVLLVLAGLFSIVSKLTGLTIPERQADWLLEYGLPYGLLAGLIIALIAIVVRRRIGNRTTR